MSLEEITDAKVRLDIPNIPVHVGKLTSSDRDVRFEGTVSLRRLLSMERDAPISQVLRAGGLQPLMDILDKGTDYNDPIMFEASWAICNIASGSSEQTKAVVDAGGIEILTKIAHSDENLRLRDQVFWTLGNIAGDGAKHRDDVIKHGILPLLIKASHERLKLSELRNISYTMSNLCRGTSPRPDRIILTCVPTLCSMLSYKDDEVVSNAAWAMSYLTDVDDYDEGLNFVIAYPPICHHLIELTKSADPSTVVPSLRSIGNICSGQSRHAQVAVDAGAIPQLVALLSHTRRAIRKEAAWSLSNIAAGSTNQVKQLLEDNFLAKLLAACQRDGDLPFFKEVLWVVNNILTSDTTLSLVVAQLVEVGWIDFLFLKLQEDDDRAGEVCELILQVLNEMVSNPPQDDRQALVDLFEEKNIGEILRDIMTDHHGHGGAFRQASILAQSLGYEEVGAVVDDEEQRRIQRDLQRVGLNRSL